MKAINIKHNVALENLSKVAVYNELCGTSLIQSPDGEIHLTADLYLESGTEDEIVLEDFIETEMENSDGLVEFNIQDFSLDEKDIEISGRSTITLAVPTSIGIKVETDNHFIAAKELQNTLELNNENGSILVSHCSGDVQIQNENGSIKMDQIQGDIEIQQENGSISTDELTGGQLKIQCENGSIKMRENLFQNVTIHSENGGVFYESLPIDTGTIEIQNENGNISLVLSPAQGFKLEARTELGQIKNTFMNANHYVTGEYSFTVGDETLHVDLTNENGGIKISTGEMMGGDVLKRKLEYIKDLLKDNSDEGIKEATKAINQLISSLTKVMDSINEEAVRDKIQKAMQYLSGWKEKLNDPEVRNNVKDSVEQASQDVNKIVQEAMKTAQEALKVAQEKFKEDFKPQFEKHIFKGKEFIKHFRNFPPIPPIPPIPPLSGKRDEKAAMQDKARMKILEMLEAGKITAEEAERLIRAIN
jgi:hypothetical protein